MFEAPYPPWDFTIKGSFAFETVIKRWPVILTGIIDNIYCRNHDLGVSLRDKTDEAEKATIEEIITEGKAIIGLVGQVKYDMARDRPLEPIPDDGEPLADVYNAELEKLAETKQNTWLAVPWLYSECYLYRLVRSYFVQTKHWKTYDPFLAQKESTFQKSSKAIYQLATTMHELEKDKDSLAVNPENLKVIFKEMVEMCLWGNATDLSMLTHLSHEQIQHLQSVGKDAQAARAEFILRDDQEKVWDHLKSFAGKADSRIDFVLDNGGFELFTDFVFADFLVTYTPYASKVVFHPKLIPWFVSDVTPPDFKSTTKSLLSPSFFPQEATPEGAPATDSSAESREHLYKMVKRWESYIDSGVFSLSVPIDSPLGSSDKKANFWTTPYPYWNMKELAPELHESLSDSSLVIFKGDLNFRKLTGDIKWPTSTPFETAIGPLAGSFPILSLRTNKADVIVAIDDEIAEKLESSGEKWRYNGKYAVVLFQPRAE
ncbi:DUF89 domain-containing protein [Trametes versicolor FP-101664 SS1]|uniref:DUF89 domain-containing protein n=1 Tax=Trametes versicolor (strain FP-101664) TaxID=717944 RepID=UPI0004623548|nr:DUF89 domain-containing protein [Trametes versicolor FP-101664 SS1]EIW56647.1 DUF89 domain-containing protein [Trametes versicolor FP-101664 SS1]